MKLYAKVNSERASKGQGGNEYVQVELYAFDRDVPIGEISMCVVGDSEGNGKQYLITWRAEGSQDEYILQEGHSEHGWIQGADSSLVRIGDKQHIHKWGSPKETETGEVVYWCKDCEATKDSTGGIIGE